jgi:phosphate transport system substrate-binding protein
LLKRSVLGVAFSATLGSALIAAPSASAQTRLNGAGATFPYPLYSKWFSEYRGAQVNYQPVGSGAGINQIKARTVDFGGTDSPLTNAELRAMPAPLLQIPTVAGAVAVTYNGLPRGLRLSGPVWVRFTWATSLVGTMRRSLALNPGVNLPNRRITVVRRSDGSGTTYIFTSYLKAVSPAWGRQVGAGKAVAWPVGLGGRGNDGVAALVKQTPGSIGYVELAFAIQQNLPYAAMRNRAGQYVLPSVDAVTAAAAASAAAIQRDIRTPIVNAAGARSYPISGFTYLMVYRNQADKAKARTMVNMLNWMMSRGQSYAKPLYYAPLPLSVRRANAIKIRSIR